VGGLFCVCGGGVVGGWGNRVGGGGGGAVLGNFILFKKGLIIKPTRCINFSNLFSE